MKGEKTQEIDSFCYKEKWHEYIHDVWLLITPRMTEQVSNIWSQKETMVAVSSARPTGTIYSAPVR